MTNLASAVLANAATDPDRVAISFQGRDITHAEFQASIRQLANALRRQGVAKGDRVAVLLNNCPEFLQCFYAITALGALYLPLNARLSPREHLALMNDARPTVLITATEFGPSIEQAREVESVCAIVLLDGATGDQLDFSTLVAAESDDFALVDVSDDADAAIVYTSGTTSLPKGVVLTHGNYLADWENLAWLWKPTADSVNIQIAPLYHAALCHSVVHLRAGARTILAPKFDPAFVLRTIQAERVTHIFCVPTIVYDLLDQPEIATTDFSSLRTFEYAAAPMTRPRLEEAMRYIPPVFLHTYGMTETTSHCGACVAADHTDHLGSIGKALPLNEMRIVDENDNEVPPDTIGEIVMRGPNILNRYWNREAETAEALKGGWMHSGDLGKRDADGFFFIVDRKKDMIISGGVNIYPKDIEEVIARDPAVAEVAVYGMPHPRWGEAVAAAIRLRPGATLDRDALQQLMEAELGRFQLPKSVEVMDDFPRNGTGKIMKHVLRKQAADAMSAEI